VIETPVRDGGSQTPEWAVDGLITALTGVIVFAG